MCSPEDDTAKPRTKSRWEKAANRMNGRHPGSDLSPFPQTPLSKIHTGHPPLVLLNHSLSVIPSSHSYSYRRPKKRLQARGSKVVLAV
ncbi:hypothetical protein SDJN02_08862, partial [Cucurbita argyrosperma subsp. argyrosperma]